MAGGPLSLSLVPFDVLVTSLLRDLASTPPHTAHPPLQKPFHSKIYHIELLLQMVKIFHQLIEPEFILEDALVVRYIWNILKPVISFYETDTLLSKFKMFHEHYQHSELAKEVPVGVKLYIHYKLLSLTELKGFLVRGSFH